MREKSEDDIQHAFLSRLKSILPGSTSLAAELSDHLDISMDSAYRRIRGETPLTLHEANVLSDAFRIPLSSLKEGSPGTVNFGYTPTAPSFESMLQYLIRLRNNLRLILDKNEKHIFYCSQDIPIFHNISHGKIGEFKLFYWMRSVLNVESLMSVKFSGSHIPEEMSAICREINELYREIPSSELWSRSTINSTLRQLQYYWESGLFNSAEEALEVIEDLRKLVRSVERQASMGIKKTGAETEQTDTYRLYISEIELTTNCALVEMEDIHAVFLGHFTFNMLQSTQESYCMETYQWFRNMMSKATLISTVGEKYRFQFFQDAHQKIDALAAMITS